MSTANFSLPSEDCWFDEVKYVELDKDEAQKKVEEYNEQGKKALPPPSTHSNRSQTRDRYDDRRDRGGYFRDRERDRDRRPHWSGGHNGGSGGGADRRGPRDSFRPAPPAPNWRGGGYGGYSGGYERRDRFSGGGGNRNWMPPSNRGRFEDRPYRGPPAGGHRRDFGGGGGYDRDRRDDRSGGRGTGGSRDNRDFRDGNRDRHGGDRQNTIRGVPQQREKDDKKILTTAAYQHQSFAATSAPTKVICFVCNCFYECLIDLR